MDTTHSIKVLTEEGLSYLKNNVLDNKTYYISNDKSYFENLLESKGYLIETNYKYVDFESDLVYSGNSDQDDFENIKIVYNAFKHLPAFMMLDDKFWAAQSHTILWNYVQKRRDDYLRSDKLTDKDIINSFFTHTSHGKKRGTYVNCISRLWWAGKLTYEGERENPYELTYQLCQTGFSSTIVPFSSSNIAGKESSRKALLTVIKEKRDEGKVVRRDDISYGLRHLNIIGGSSIVDSISYDEILEILRDYYTRMFASDIPHKDFY